MDLVKELEDIRCTSGAARRYVFTKIIKVTGTYAGTSRPIIWSHVFISNISYSRESYFKPHQT